MAATASARRFERCPRDTYRRESGSRLHPRDSFIADRWAWLALGLSGLIAAHDASQWWSTQRLSLGLLGVPAFAIGLFAGIDRLCRRLIVTAEGVRVRGLVHAHTAPWAAVRDVRRRGDKVVLDLGAARRRELRFDGAEGRPSATRVVAVIRALKATQPVSLAQTSKSGLSWGVILVVGYVAVMGTAAMAVITRL